MEKKIKIAFFDAKPYDIQSFNKLNTSYDITYFEEKLRENTVSMAKGFDAVCAFVNDNLNKEVIEKLYEYSVKVIVMRCAGYNNVDFRAAFKKINILRVPSYSPHAVAEHAFALLMTLNRKIHKAYIRTRDFNFSLNGLMGIDLYNKTVGVIGTGRIGQAFINICHGLGMKVIAYDKFPSVNDIEYVELDELFRRSDCISLHCPLTEENRHVINKDAFMKMKDGVILINTSRGALINSTDLLEAVNNGKVKEVGLDVYEEEADYFYEDKSQEIIKDNVLSLLVSKPNVIITSHQAFLTEEALENIAETTLKNLDDFFSNSPLKNEICYHCVDGDLTENCPKLKNHQKKCF